MKYWILSAVFLATFISLAIGSLAGPDLDSDGDNTHYPLFTSGVKIYLNDSLNKVRNILTDNELPNILHDGQFNGSVSARYTQVIKLGSYPKLVFQNQPTGDSDPVVGFALGT